jgi:hypothetical protein
MRKAGARIADRIGCSRVIQKIRRSGALPFLGSGLLLSMAAIRVLS